MTYTSIRTSVLRGDQKITFDVYIEIAGKHILYLRKGESFEGARLNRLKDKKVKKMYISLDAEKDYLRYLAQNIERAYGKAPDQSLESRTLIAQGLQQAATEAVFENPGDKTTYEEAKARAQQFAEFILKENEAIRSLLALGNPDKNLAQHGVLVASMAIEIARATKYPDMQNAPTIALGGMLHDLGHHLSGQDISHPVSGFSQEEMTRYKMHVSEGAKKLKDLQHMDQHILQIIMQHEEHADGSGFPSGLTERQCSPLALFVQSANIFDRLVNFENVEKSVAAKRLLGPEFIGLFPLSHLQAIKEIVNRLN